MTRVTLISVLLTYVSDQTQAPTQPNVESCNLCLFIKSCWKVNVLRTQSFVACAVELNLAWNLTETERLTLHYDSVEELGG